MAKKRVMISQPMRGLTEKEILRARDQAWARMEEKGFEVVNTFFAAQYRGRHIAGVSNVPLFMLSKSLEAMAGCDAVYFCEGWNDARGCRIERAAAVAYGLEVFYAEDFEEEEN